MKNTSRFGTYLLLTVQQWFHKFPSIHMVTNKITPFCKNPLRPRNIDSLITNKCTGVDNCMSSSECRLVFIHPLAETFRVSSDSLSNRSFHLCTENQLQTRSSSTIRDHTTAEDCVRTKTDMSQFVVNHDQDKKCFYITLQEANPSQQEVQARLEYSWVRPGVVNMYHTEVPPQFQGRGIAKVLAAAAFDAFSQQGVVMRPTCSYLQKFLRENPAQQYLEHIDKGFDL